MGAFFIRIVERERVNCGRTYANHEKMNNRKIENGLEEHMALEIDQTVSSKTVRRISLYKKDPTTI